MLFNNKIEPTEVAEPKDVKLLKLAIKLVQGYVENSRSENGVSYAVNQDRVNQNIAQWCSDYGISADDVIVGRTIINGSNLW